MATSRSRELAGLLRLARERRRLLGLPSPDTEVYRLVHGAVDGLAGLTVDVYGQFVVVSLFDERSESELNLLCEGLRELGFLGVYLKRRPRQANVLSDAERRERAPERALVGTTAEVQFPVLESGMPFQVRLGDGLSTGLFLDQRLNRQRLCELSAGKRVLNLFAYTCAFGCAAALGGATVTTNLDVSKGALERGRENYAQAGLDPSLHGFLARDVLEILPKLVRRAESYDLIVLDPPSYASTKRGRFSIEQDLAGLIADSLRLLSEGGRLLVCTNQHSLSLTVFERLLRQGALQAQRAVQIEFMPSPPDFEAPQGADPHLKSAWVAAR